jgi:hypothetical protein
MKQHRIGTATLIVIAIIAAFAHYSACGFHVMSVEKQWREGQNEDGTWQWSHDWCDFVTKQQFHNLEWKRR